jgi:hypothetical protein
MNMLIAEILATLAIKFFDRAAQGPEYQRGKGPGEREKRLREKIKKIKKRLSIVLICALILTGCMTTRVIMLEEDQAYQLAEDTKALVWVETEDNKMVKGKAVLPAGIW